jgi:hypothetical protein
MADREQPYDPYIPAGGAGAQQGAQGQNGNHRTAALQAVRLPLSPSPRHSRSGFRRVAQHILEVVDLAVQRTVRITARRAEAHVQRPRSHL